MRERAAEPVEFPDDQAIARLHIGECLLEAGAVGPRSAGFVRKQLSRIHARPSRRAGPLRPTPLVSCTGRSYATIRLTKPGGAPDRVRCTAWTATETDPAARRISMLTRRAILVGARHRVPAGHIGEFRGA